MNINIDDPMSVFNEIMHRISLNGEAGPPFLFCKTCSQFPATQRLGKILHQLFS